MSAVWTTSPRLTRNLASAKKRLKRTIPVLTPFPPSIKTDVIPSSAALSWLSGRLLVQSPQLLGWIPVDRAGGALAKPWHAKSQPVGTPPKVHFHSSPGVVCGEVIVSEVNSARRTYFVGSRIAAPRWKPKGVSTDGT